MQDFTSGFFTDLAHTSWYEYIAVFAGILSVWLSRKEHVAVYPVGLVNTLIYVIISLQAHLPGEAIVNMYFTIMGIFGWYQWARKDAKQKPLLHISLSSRREWYFQLSFFCIIYVIMFFFLHLSREAFFPGAIPWADALAAAAAFTGMWLMTRKKMENWIWWILTNIVSVPLYFVKHYVFSGLYYFVLLIMAIQGWQEWRKKYRHAHDS